MEVLPRKLSEHEISFLKEVDVFNQVLEFTALISLNQGGIDADGRGVRGVKIFTRQTVIAFSLSRILPKPKVSTASDTELWDISSIASLTRNIVEGYLSLYYFGTEKISESEAELRYFILQLHRNIEWFNIQDIENQTEYKEFIDGIAEQKERIKNHIYLKELSPANRNKALQFTKMYKTKNDFEKELCICKDLRKIYRFLSNLVHPLPLSIERTDNLHGRGIGSEIDIIYCLQCLKFGRRFLAASVVEVVEHFPIELKKIFSDKLEIIRPLQFKDFEN